MMSWSDGDRVLFENYTSFINISGNDTENSTDDSSVDELTKSIVKWINGFIIILGFITNTLILVILGCRKIGSQTTRIILLFLAATDLVVMFVELFIHYIPYYWQWFPVFYTDLSCAVAFFSQAAVITASSWYIMLMTLERFTVVWLPMKAKFLCTKGKILAVCILIPIVSLSSYWFLLFDIGGVPNEESGYIECKPKKIHTRNSHALEFKSKLKIWIVLYFFIPAIVIVIFNTLIVFRLGQSLKFRDRNSSNSIKSKSHSAGRKLSRTMTRSNSQSSNTTNIKKATSMVIAASVTFVLLMIPRGVVTTIILDAKWNYSSKTEFIFDAVAYLLQYLNHAINFFLYVLVNRRFRDELKAICCCRGRKGYTTNRYRTAGSETETTRMTRKRKTYRSYHGESHHHGESNHRESHRRESTGSLKISFKLCLQSMDKEAENEPATV